MIKFYNCLITIHTIFSIANCGENKVYHPYITGPQPSCKEPNPPQVKTLPPVEGCVCAEGYILDNAEETCIPVEECGCSTDDNYYAVSYGKVFRLSAEATRHLNLSSILNGKSAPQKCILSLKIR